MPKTRIHSLKVLLTLLAGTGALLLLLAATGGPLLAGRTPAAGVDLEALDEWVARAVGDWEVPGLAVAVVKDGELVFAKGYGVRELGGPEAVDIHTLFAIGSTTKAMTAAAIGMLVEEGKLAWDDPVIEHLPDFRLRDPVVTRELTIRDLLTHRGGLGNADFLWYGQDNRTEDIIHRLRYLEPAYSIRSRFIYQNIMYATAGEVIEAVSGQEWKSFVSERIFEPLGMSSTIATAARLGEQPNVASPHYRLEGTVEVIENASVDSVAAAGSVWSSVSDMSRWLMMLLRGGKTADGRVLLKPETVEELFTPQTIVGANGFYPTARLVKPHWTTYGFGWFQQDYRGRAVDFHTGSIDGMVAIAGLIRDEGLGVYVLGNRDHAELRHAIMYRVFDLYGGDASDGRDWSQALLELYGELEEEADKRRQEAESERVEGTTPSLPLEQYIGEFGDRLYGTVRVSRKNGELYLSYGPGLAGALEHWHYDSFRVHWDARWRGSSLVSFELDEEGKASRLTLSGAEFRREAASEAASASPGERGRS